jgi:tripartite-type tricarboxylate transporter receptor subunit TctC
MGLALWHLDEWRRLMQQKRRVGSFVLAAALLWLSAASAQEQPTRIIFPFAAGGSGDALARLIADKLRASLGRHVIVENRTGGAGRIGVAAVKNSVPDGTTLLLTPIAPVAVYQHSYKSLDYDPIRDFQAITQVGTFDFGIAAGAHVPAQSLQELVAWARVNVAAANYGIPAAGTLPHFLGAMYARAAGIDLRPVPYRGSAAALTDLIGGQIPMVITTVSDLVEMHKGNRIRVLATSDRERSRFLPNVPTLREAGYDLAATGWYGLFAPAHTPGDILERLNRLVVAAVQSSDVKEQLQKFGLHPTGTTAAEFARILKADSEFWAAAVKASGFTAEP